MIRFIVLIIVLILGLLFALENGDRTTLRMFFGAITWQDVPMYLVILTSFGLGITVTGIMLVPEWIRTRLELRRQRRQIAALEERLSNADPSLPPSVPQPPRLFPDDVA